MRNQTLILSATLIVSFLFIVPIPLAFASSGFQLNSGGVNIHGGRNACPTASCSLNWSGYALNSSANSVTDVKGTFTVPTVNCETNNAFASFWVGIDGFNDQTVEQTGVTANPCNSLFAPAGYSAWYEFYPAAPVYASFSVSPGDIVAAGVTYSTTQSEFTTTLTVTTSSGSAVGTLTETQAVSGAQRQSAEWIAEAPSISRHVLPLADFATIAFSADYATISSTTYSIEGFPPGTATVNQITMVTHNLTVKALPSSLSYPETSFTVTWEHS